MSAALHTKSYRLVGLKLSVVIDPHAIGDLGPQEYGAVVSSSFRDDAVERCPQPLSVKRSRHLPGIDEAIAAYNDGELDALDAISVTQHGAPFQQRVWAKMRTIAPGTVLTYAQLAVKAGTKNAYRAVGTTCAQNSVAPFVPCHRVVAANGIGGYGYGIDAKVALLEHEGYLL